MAHLDTRFKFSKKEYELICELTRQKLVSSSDKQKGIRSKLRKMGFYWDDYNFSKTPFNLETLRQLFTNGTLSIEDDNMVNQHSEKREVNESIKIHSSQIKQKDINGREGRQGSDEAYIIDLCDEILGIKASRQHRFEFLTGDTGRMLPVDAFYKEINLVVEYYERQHTEEVRFFDNKLTVSGVSRGVQRKIYDERRKEILPTHGISLLIISYKDLGDSKKLKRDRAHDIIIIRSMLKDYLS